MRPYPALVICSANGGGAGGPGPTKIPLGGAVARVFPNVSFAMCPLKVF